MSVGTCRWLTGVPVRSLKVRRHGRQRNRRYPNAVARSSACVASPWQYGQAIVPPLCSPQYKEKDTLSTAYQPLLILSPDTSLRKSNDEIGRLNGWQFHRDGIHLNSRSGEILADLVQQFLDMPAGVDSPTRA